MPVMELPGMRKIRPKGKVYICAEGGHTGGWRDGGRCSEQR